MKGLQLEKEQYPGALQASVLEGKLPGLVHGFSTRLGFAEHSSFSKAMKEVVSPLWVGTPPEPLLLDQPHSANILIPSKEAPSGADSSGGARPPPESGAFQGAGYDGAVAHQDAPWLLGVRVADCVPILAVDGETRSYAALHAGWRGTAQGILPRLLSHWRKQGSSLGGLALAFGPAIGGCCYEVGGDCLAAFHPHHLEGAVHEVGGKTHLDLHAVLTRQAREMGVAEGQIESLTPCTRCHRDANGGHPFASYRRSTQQGEPTDGRNAGFIGLLPSGLSGA